MEVHDVEQLFLRFDGFSQADMAGHNKTIARGPEIDDWRRVARLPALNTDEDVIFLYPVSLKRVNLHDAA